MNNVFIRFEGAHVVRPPVSMAGPRSIMYRAAVPQRVTQLDASQTVTSLSTTFMCTVGRTLQVGATYTGRFWLFARYSSGRCKYSFAKGVRKRLRNCRTDLPHVLQH